MKELRTQKETRSGVIFSISFGDHRSPFGKVLWYKTTKCTNSIGHCCIEFLQNVMVENPTACCADMVQ